MKKTLGYIAVLAVMAWAGWYFLMREKNLFSSEETAFNFKDSLAIGKIVLGRPTGDIVRLEKKEGQWWLNDSYKARKASLSQLFYVLYKQQAVSPAPNSAHNTVIEHMATHAIKVELYDHEGKPLRKFFVGGEVGNTDGSYMLMEGAKRPYMVQIPQHNGYLSPFYEPNVIDWRDRSVFDVAPENLKKVEIQYFDNPINSFVYQKTPKGISVETTPSLMKAERYNQRRANVYANFFTYVNMEAYINGTPGLDTLIQERNKRAVIRVWDNNDRTDSLIVYWMPIQRTSKNIDMLVPGIPEGYDADRMYGLINGEKDTILIQTNTFDKILRKGFEFYTPDNESAPQQKHDHDREHHVHSEGQEIQIK